MSLQIDIDPHGVERVPFRDLRAQLFILNRAFSEADLRKLPYHDLAQAATISAGKAACTLHAVVEEKQNRRFRFLHMTPDELAACKGYLRKEGMYEDIFTEVMMRHAPHWSDLTPRARLWFKLNCLYTHVDLPTHRLEEALLLIDEAVQAGQLRLENAKRMNAVITRLLTFHPQVMDDDTLRGAIGSLAEEVLSYLDDHDKSYCQRELIADYTCTAGCYHAVPIFD